MRKRALLFMKTQDLETLHHRVMSYLQDRIRRADPFYFEIKKTQPVELHLQDLIDKYKKVAKKDISDPYWISDDKKMLILVVKPMWDSTDLNKTGAFVKKLRAEFAAYSQDNAHGVKLVEDYGKADPTSKAKIDYGFTGSYKLGYDEQFEIKRSLIPVSGLALLGVVLVMLAFFRRRVGAVVLVLLGLMFGVALSFGFAYLAVGELNMVTSMLAGILMGLGIDFGIHAVYRLREELATQPTVREAVYQTVTHQGPASFISAAGIGVAFFSLLFSSFRGFSQFGLLAGAGTFLIGVAIYVWIPAAILVLERWKPGTAAKLVGTLDPAAEAAAAKSDRIPRPRLLLGLSLTVAVGIALFAPKVKFDYNTRTLAVEHQASIELNDMISDRFGVSSDPAAIFTPTLTAAKKVYDKLEDGKYDAIDQVVSVYTFVPPAKQQAANYKIIEQWKAELAKINPAILPEKIQKRWHEALSYLDVHPYTVHDLPDYILQRFQALPSAKPENHGWLTFVYPTVNIWDGKQILHFAHEAENIQVGPHETYHTAGLIILYAKLATIVLHDAEVAVAITAVLLLVILLLDLRSFTGAMVALLPLVLGVGMMLGAMTLFGESLNFMNIVVFPIVLGYGVSHGVYLMHRFNEGTSPRAALRSVGKAVAASTLTTLAGWAALLAAAHRGLQTMGILACLGMTATLVVSFTVMPAVLQLLHDRRTGGKGGSGKKDPEDEQAAA